MKRVLVTGGCGFVGHHFIEHLLRNTNFNIVIVDKLTYATNGFDKLRAINALNNNRVKILTWDLCREFSEGVKKEIGEVDYIVHFAAESHVDRSLQNSIPFVQSNVLGTARLLEYVKTLKGLKLYIGVNTDEVYGPAKEGEYHKETDKFLPSNPYSAAKAGEWALEYAFAHSFKLPICNIHCMNIFAERQHIEKFVPKTVKGLLTNNRIVLHASNGVFSSRKWIHARNVADAILFLFEHGKIGESYNIAGEEKNVYEFANIVCKVIKGRDLIPDDYIIEDAHSYRPGHDLRYSLDNTKLLKLGWKPKLSFEESLTKMVKWMIDEKHSDWLK